MEKGLKTKELRWKLAVLRYYKLVTALLIILIIAFGYYFILEPRYQQVRIGGGYNLDTLQTEMKKRQTYLDNLKTLKTTAQTIQPKDLARVKNILPDQKDVPGIFVQLETLALKNNFIISGVTINEAASEVKIKTNEPTAQVKKLSISLNLLSADENGYLNLKNFLADLESNLRLFDVSAVYFSPESTAYSLNIFTYYLDQPAN